MPEPATRLTLVSLVALTLAVLIVAGSRALAYFDPAVTGYAVATVVAAGAVVWRFTAWLSRPATRLFWRRGWVLVLARRDRRHLAGIPRTAVQNVMAQSFIWTRARLRWVMHVCLAWGCGVSLLTAVPLVWGWLHFEALPGDEYRLMLWGLPGMRFAVRSVTGFLVFNALSLAAVAVLAGCVIAIGLRWTDRGVRSCQQSLRDWLPLMTLSAVALTGLGLTVDAHWLGGRFYLPAAVAHELSVVFLLLYFPFSKLFHAVQRPAAIGVDLYHRVARQHGGHVCAACGGLFGLAMQVQDVQGVLAEMGADFQIEDGNRWQDLCIKCRRLQRARWFRAAAGDRWI